MTEKYDVVVVGSGPSGAAVALELVRKGARVLMLERGSAAPVKGSLWQTLRWLGWPGRGLKITTGGIPITRGVTLGGSSVFYYGTAYDVPLEDFAALGIDLKPHLYEVSKEVPTAKLRPSLIGPMAKMIMAAAQENGIDWQPLQKFIYQDRCRTFCWKCQYGCPYGAKWNGRMFVEKAVPAGLEMRSEALVHDVIQEGGKAQGVSYTWKGTKRTVLADKVVLSAGGIGSAEILRRSGFSEAGKDFFVDPLIVAFGFVDKVKPTDGLGYVQETPGREIPMATGVRFQDEGYVMTDMTVPRPLYQGMAAARGRFHRLFQHRRALSIMVKIRDELGGSFTQLGIRKPLTTDDWQKIDNGYARAKDVLKTAGAKKVFRSQVFAAHPGGTARINHIVDTDLQTSVKGLYVCDCSVIPKPWGLPPTLTLICLGHRLGTTLS